MVIQYKTVKDVMTALLAGKKLTKSIWNYNQYIHILNDAFVDPDGDSTYVSLADASDADDYFIEYIPKQEIWDCWNVGDYFEYKTDNYSFGKFKILFINDKVCFCEKVNSVGYDMFGNKPDSNRKMKRI